MQHEFQLEADNILREEVTRFFGPHLSGVDLSSLVPIISRHIRRSFEATSTMDASLRMRTVAAATTTPLVDFCAKHAGLAALDQIVQFRETLAQRMTSSLTRLREQYLNGEKGPAPASAYLGRSRPVYEFIRVTLGVRMHGAENLHKFSQGPGVEEHTIGQNISLIHEAIRDGKMQDIVVGLFA